MLTIKDLANPNLKNKESDLNLLGAMKLRDVSIKSLQNIISEYINVIDETDTLIDDRWIEDDNDYPHSEYDEIDREIDGKLVKIVGVD